MNILLISDVHANFPALLTIEHELQQADYILSLGDWVGYHTDVNEVIDYIRQFKNCISVLGNHDYFVLHGCPPSLSPKVKAGIDYAANVIRPDNKAWLAALPITWAGLIDKLSFFLVHGSPWRPFTDYLYADNPRLAELDAFEYDIIAFGQTHRAYVRDTQKPFLINPGSVGQSRDRKDTVSALSMDTVSLKVTIIEKKITSSPQIISLPEVYS